MCLLFILCQTNVSIYDSDTIEECHSILTWPSLCCTLKTAHCHAAASPWKLDLVALLEGIAGAGAVPAAEDLMRQGAAAEVAN